jgi:hypothetical protein
MNAPMSGSQSPKNFFISHNRADTELAVWIAWQLEEAGYTTVVQAWDFRPGNNFVLEMQKATAECERTIAVVSQDYLNAMSTQPEWAAAFGKDPTGEKGTLLPVRVGECDLKGLWPQILYIDLVGLDEESMRKRLVKGVRRGRVKPKTKPPFQPSRTPIKPTSPAPVFSCSKTLQYIRRYFSKPSWQEDPILLCSRALFYHPLSFASKAHESLSLREVAQLYPNAVIKGEERCGKTSSMCHIVREMLQTPYELPNLPLLVDLSQIGAGASFDSLPELLKAVGDPVLQEALDQLETAWSNGRLWLILDNIDTLSPSMVGRVSQFIRYTFTFNRDPSLGNRIWLVASSETVEHYFKNSLDAFESLQVQRPNRLDILDYMCRFKPLLGSQWGTFHDFCEQWIAPPCNPRSQEFFLINLASKIFTENGNISIDYALDVWGTLYLQSVLPTKLQASDSIKSIHLIMTKLLAEWIVRLKRSECFNWGGGIPEDIFEKHRPDELMLQGLTESLVSVNDDGNMQITDPAMGCYWMSRAVERTRKKQRTSERMYRTLAELIRTARPRDFGVFCLKRLLRNPVYGEEVLQHMISLLSEWDAPEDTTRQAVCYWQVLPDVLQLKHFGRSAQEHFITELQKMMDSHENPWDEGKISQAARLALDTLAINDIQLPESLGEDILRPFDLARHNLLAAILHRTPSEVIEKNFWAHTTQHKDLLFKLLEDYPNTNVIRQIIDICFDYSRHVGSSIIQDVLDRFEAFRSTLLLEASPENLDHWMQCLQENPAQLYQEDHHRTVLLCEWIAKDRTCRFEYETVRRLYNFGKTETDNPFRATAIRLLKAQPGDETWLREIYGRERAREVQKEIIAKLIELRALSTLKPIIEKQQPDVRALTLGEWLTTHPQTIHDDESGMLDVAISDIGVLEALTEYVGSTFLRAQITAKYLEAHCRTVTLREAKALVKLYPGKEVVKEVLAGLQHTGERKRFLEETCHDWDECPEILHDLLNQTRNADLFHTIGQCLASIKE